ncbi:MAG: imidazole glycerol phosphate synthase subunit HisF [Rhodospirillaceae bacterium]|jgi:imidazole glycerol-phosphate synthase subunit HisF|nr:imidazole glycerol phosphate synthase subunit HisF [Rhodospirillaceae bacterium]MBT6428734.1 imidazole glycerol phosphate synthase subunit HisF [Rhodospirillaceae bacterium]MBT7760314.1 imidazole glycerol phosphate synthase subunit HisF [Rhodospirillaceae bacterium]
MLKTRVMPTLLLKDFGLVKGVGFDPWRRTGSPHQAIIVYNMREVDELVFVDISATPSQRPPDFDLIDELADECFMPMTVGGGIRSVDDMRRVIAAGADKIVINSAALETPGLITDGAARFGSQCIVVSIDVFRNDDGDCMVHSHCGQQPTGRDPVEWAKEAEGLGAGEILLTSIDRDGTMDGYDVPLTRSVCEAVRIPVVASGGAGNYAHMAEVLKDGGATAVAASSIFLFTEQTPKEAKLYLKEQGFNVRI